MKNGSDTMCLCAGVNLAIVCKRLVELLVIRRVTSYTCTLPNTSGLNPATNREKGTAYSVQLITDDRPHLAGMHGMKTTGISKKRLTRKCSG